VFRTWYRIAAGAACVVMMATALVGVIGSGPAAAAGPAPVNVGIVCGCTGPLASSIAVGPPAYEAWAKYQNSHGGLDGHKINVIVKDDDFNPGTSLAEVEDLITQDHVVALVDGSDVDAAWGTYAKEHTVPVVGGGSSSELFVTNPDFFSVGQTLTDLFVNYMLAAKKVGVKKFGELYCTVATCQEGVAPLKKTGAALGVTVAYVTQISSSSPNYTAQCLAAKQAGVQILEVADSVNVVESVARDCTEQGYTPWNIAVDGGIAKAFSTSPGLEDKFIGSEPDIPFFADNTPAAKLMNANLEKYARSTLDSPNWNEEGTQFYLSGMLLDAAVSKSGATKKAPITTAEVKAGLYKLHADTLSGLAPPLTFKKSAPTPVDCWYWIRIENKKFTTPYGVKPVCVAPPKGTL